MLITIIFLLYFQLCIHFIKVWNSWIYGKRSVAWELVDVRVHIWNSTAIFWHNLVSIGLTRRLLSNQRFVCSLFWFRSEPITSQNIDHVIKFGYWYFIGRASFQDYFTQVVSILTRQFQKQMTFSNFIQSDLSND